LRTRTFDKPHKCLAPFFSELSKCPNSNLLNLHKLQSVVWG
jgi:hypothetical protein